MENLKIDQSILKIPNAKTFVQECHNSLHKVTDGAPYDGSVSLSADYDGEQFITTIKLVSSSLRFTLARAARSPFAALESAIQEALEKIHLWSSMKNKSLDALKRSNL